MFKHGSWEGAEWNREGAKQRRSFDADAATHFRLPFAPSLLRGELSSPSAFPARLLPGGPAASPQLQ